MSRFPRLTETFVLYELLALMERGIEVELYPLLCERAEVRHEAVQRVQGRVRYQPFLSFGILRANWHFLRHRPRRYLRAVRRAHAREPVRRARHSSCRGIAGSG